MAWFGIGVASACAVCFMGLLFLDPDLRRAAGEVALAFLFGPAALLVAMTRRGPRMSRIQPKTLERFLRQGDQEMVPAWMLSYGGRGILFVRRRRDHGWRNNVPNRMVDADRRPGS